MEICVIPTGRVRLPAFALRQVLSAAGGCDLTAVAAFYRQVTRYAQDLPEPAAILWD